MPLSGAAIGAGTAGIILLYSALSGTGVLAATRDVVSGKKPAPLGTGPAAPAGGGSTGSSAKPSGAADAVNQALGESMAAAYGWVGSQWTALNEIVMEESGWDDEAANPTSNARGIAQRINGWGPGYREGNAPEQIAWLLNYVKQRYGTPEAALQFHNANGWY